MANDQDFKTFVYDLVLPDFLCIQETWLVPQLQLIIPRYTSVRKDKRNGWEVVRLYKQSGKLKNKWQTGDFGFQYQKCAASCSFLCFFNK